MRLRWSRRSTSVTAAVAAPALVLALALAQHGFPVSRLSLDDGGVWITSRAALELGRFNVPVQELDGGLTASATSFDVAQDGDDVLLVEPTQVSVVDVAAVATSAKVALGGGDEVAMAGGTVAVDDGAGKVWARTLAGLAGLDVVTGQPDVDLGSGGKVVVAVDGSVLTVAADGSTATRTAGQTGSTARAGSPVHGAVSAVDGFTAVGEEPVVLDGSTVRTRYAAVTLPSGGPFRVQRPGPAASTVLVAGPDRLYEVPLHGGRATAYPTGSSGTPAAPVRVGGCAYAAWAAPTGNWLRICGTAVTKVDRQGVTAADELVFRVNRSQVVLNDVASGRAWLPADPAVKVPNWTAVKPTQSTTSPKTDDGSDTTRTASDTCSDQGTPPVAVDDDFGVRPGRSTLLPVLANDSTSDCGILAITAVDPVPVAFGTVRVVAGGRELQVDVADSARGSTSFTYTVTDRPGTRAPATATVRLTVHGDDVNSPPRQTRVPTMQVEQGGTAQLDVLDYFEDPDGDDLVLVGASLPADNGSVSYRADGTVTVSAAGAAGSATLTVLVSDGRGDDPVRGEVVVDVRDKGQLAPQLDPVHETGFVNKAIVVDPLAAVRTSSTEPNRLAAVGSAAGATITPDLAHGTFTFTAARAGTYYVSFTVVAGSASSTGWARIDVADFPDQVGAPVAVLDEAYLPVGGTVTIDPLANDEDPNDLVLVLLDATPAAGSGLHAAVVDHHLVEISADRTPTGPELITYEVSNGTLTSTGTIVVHSITPAASPQAPVVHDVEATVRTGGVVTIDALAGAYDPDGGTLTLVRRLPQPLADGQGLLFVSGSVLRYQAPATPMTVTATFAVQNSEKVTSSARVTVHVHASDAATKTAPVPQAVTARVFQGETVRIPIPLVGIDPDGDGVTLLGVGDTHPRLGNITAIGADYLEYAAQSTSVGTDTFTYAVEDWTGQRAVGQIQVGIAPRPTSADTVVARDDAVTVAPGQKVEVRVLDNDVDSGGGQLSLAPTLELSGDVGAGAGKASATVDGSRVAVTAPSSPGLLRVAYTAVSDRGGQDQALLDVTVRTDAPIEPPVAQDVVVPATQTIGRTKVEVDVLAVAANPSGPLSDLQVRIPASAAPAAEVTATGSVLVTLADHAQTLPYELVNTRDPDAFAYAFITVPALGFFPPIARPKAPALRVASGQSIDISLDAQVQVAPGRSPTLADATNLSATGGSVVATGNASVRFTAAADFVGTAQVMLLVTDSTGPGDTQARQATIPLSIAVYSQDQHPPTFSPSAVQVPVGEPAQPFDLDNFLRAPDGSAARAGQYKFTIVDAVPVGFTATMTSDTVLSVSAAATATGATGTLALKIGYGTSGSMSVSLRLQAIASERRLADVQDWSLAGKAGQPTTVSVLEGAYDPYAGSGGGGLTVVGASTQTANSGTVTTTASSVTVTPAAGFVGVMLVIYRVRDVTNDPDREVEGTISLQVAAVPDAPAQPHTDQVGDGTVQLSWNTPSSNGAAVTGYRVTVSPGGATHLCTATTCTIDGLTNGTSYTFTVAALNQVGWSVESAPSDPARPDTVPAAPAAPTLTVGNQQVTASWQPPADTGSPVVSYQVQVSPAPSDPSQPDTLAVTGTTATFSGLANGGSYAVRVRASNSSPTPGPWSGWSATATPATVPDQPGNLTAQRVNTPAGGQIAVGWAAPDDNGAALTGYVLTVSGGGGPYVYRLGADATSWPMTNAVNGVPYTFSLVATNAIGPSAAATASASTYGLPGTPTVTAVTGSQTPGTAVGQARATVTWTAADGNGLPVTGYHLKVNGTDIGSVGTGTSDQLTGLSGGQDVSVQAQACSLAGCGSWSAAVTSSPTPQTVPGSVGGVTVVVSADPTTGSPTQVAATWSAPDWGGTGAGSYDVTVTTTDGASIASTTTSTPAVTISTGLPTLSATRTSVTFVVSVRAHNGLGASDASSGQGQATFKPPPTDVTVTKIALGASGQNLNMTWTAVSGATGYQLQAKKGDGDWSDVLTWTDTELTAYALPLAYRVGAGQTLTVRIRAVDAAGRTSPDWTLQTVSR